MCPGFVFLSYSDIYSFYEGEVTTDIRQGNNNPLENKKVGDIWIPKKYLFSNKKDKYYDNTQYRFIIKSKTGRDVGSKVDNYKINKEVIFKRNSTFQIIDIKILMAIPRMVQQQVHTCIFQ